VKTANHWNGAIYTDEFAGINPNLSVFLFVQQLLATDEDCKDGLVTLSSDLSTNAKRASGRSFATIIGATIHENGFPVHQLLVSGCCSGCGCP
jgi:hypothetical protein